MRSIDIGLILQQTPELAWATPASLSRLAGEAKLELYQDKEIIHQVGEDEPTFLVVVSGVIHSMRKEGRFDRLEKIIYENQVFGMSELFESEVSKGTMLVASSMVLLLTIPLGKARACLEEHEETKETFGTLLENYEAYHFIRYSTFLGEMLNPSFLVRFVSAFELKEYKAKEAVFFQNDDPDGFYLCVEGKLRIEVKVGEQVVFSAGLQAGDYFGELALTTDSKRSASILSEESARCYYLGRESFDTLVKHEPKLLEGFQLLAKLAYG